MWYTDTSEYANHGPYLIREALNTSIRCCHSQQPGALHKVDISFDREVFEIIFLIEL
jgi:hypothetical protein